jgi:para-aminobenzoate synthetase/4-amino-4-deoxychorismate lyase
MSPGAPPRLVRRALDWDLTPAGVLRLVRADPHPVALFGAWAGGSDIVGSRPVLVRASAGGSLDDVLDAGPDIPARDGAAFGGGWIGYLGYSAAGEALPTAGPRRLPGWWFGWYDHVLRRDRATGEWFFEALWTDERAAALERRFAELSAAAAAGPPPSESYDCGVFRLIPSPASHQAAVRRAVEYIWAGDIFQANICLRAEASFSGDPLDAFCQAAAGTDPPYAAFAATGGGAVASLSPELFLRRTGRTVVSRPIKGTAPRADDGEQAAAQRAGLERSAKNRAENVMIVDLVRNDLSRVCVPGSVTAPGLLGAEPHPGVWHLVSTVSGTLRDDATDGDLIRAAFPPGSVTGAPKVRALEVIDELEAAPREVYTGAIGYRSPIAGLELNVAIRTFEFAAGRVWLGVGGGIVADSGPEAEYAECLTKATPLLTAIGARLDAGAAGPATPLAGLAPRPTAGVFSSLMVSNGETRGLASHLDRLRASVTRLYHKDLPASLPAELARCLARKPTGRLRVTVRPVGGPLQATVEVVPADPPPRAVTLRQATVPGGVGAHKYRDRRLLTELGRQARLGPGEQLLLTDDTGELLETDRANLFAVADGVLLTPPADGRILPGTTRAAIIAAAHEGGVKVGFKPLTLDQLQAASEVFVTNAVVGVLPVTAVLPADALPADALPAAGGWPASWEPGPLTARLAAALAARPPDPAPAPPAASPALLTSPAATPASPGRIGVRVRPLVVLVDNYDSFTWNLADLLATAGCQVEVVRNDELTAAQVAGAHPDGVVISPGPCAPAEAGISVDVVRRCAGVIPLLGICLGHQAIAAAFGADVIRAPRPVHGQAFDVSHDGSGVLAGLPSPFPATRYHSLIVDEHALPADLVITARSGSLPMGLRRVAAGATVEGVQFHPESVLTAHGAAIIANFVAALLARGDDPPDPPAARPILRILSGALLAEAVRGDARYREQPLALGRQLAKVGTPYRGQLPGERRAGDLDGYQPAEH